MKDLSRLLQLGLEELSLTLSEVTQEKLIKYSETLIKWNKVYNLTSVNAPKDVLVRHIFDSLSIVPYINGPYVLDFGTGAGLPGIPLALALPNINFVLLDSVGKKTTFLNHVVLTLNLDNVKIVNKRIEEFRFEDDFATIVTRATSDISTVFDKTKHLLKKSGQILVMKGRYPESELVDFDALAKPYQINVPYLDEERYLIKVQCRLDACKQK